MAAEWGAWGVKLLNMAFGMAPKLVPQHLQRQALTRVRDLNPFHRIADQGDLRRALRLAWIEAAFEVERAVADGVKHDGEWASQADEVQRFSAVMKVALKQQRDAAFDRRQPPGPSAIDAQLSQLLVEMPAGLQHEAGGAGPGDGLTHSFVAVLAAETGWRIDEVPPLYARVAEQGVLQRDGWSRSFGELVFAAFAELLKQPGRYPEAGVEFQAAMTGMAREVAVATLQGVQGLDEKLDRALTQLGEAGRFTGLEAFVSGVEQRLVEKMERSFAQMPHETARATINGLMAALDAKGLFGNGSQVVDRETVIALARRLRPEESLDFDQALRELEHAVDVAREVVATGEHAATRDAFIDRVLQRVAEKTRAGQLDEGAEELDAALAEIDRRDQARRRRQCLPLLKGVIRQAVLRRNVPRAAQAVLQIGALDDPVRPAWSAAYRERLAAFMDTGEQQGINLLLEIAITLAREQLDAATGNDERWEACNRLGASLTCLGERESGTARLEEAVQVYREALKEFTQERVPLAWAAAQNNLGNALGSLGERERGTARLQEAVRAYREALKDSTQERVPLDWARTQNNLGTALMSLGEREDDAARLQEAVQAFRAALKEFTQERVPLDWAMAQNNLGTALRKLDEHESDTAYLEEAVQAFQAALEERTQERVPLAWAATQNNLGNALLSLGERESGTARLQEAVQAFRAALKEYAQERVPLDWAMTQSNLGNALMRLSERENDTARLQEAVQAYREALKERTQEREPLNWAGTQNNLGNALLSLGEREDDAARLQEAVQAFRAALKEFTQERMPLDWAAAQNNLGNALLSLGERENDAARLQEAVQAYREALKERTQERMPLSWAAAQNNLGTALLSLGERENDAARLQEAVQAYREALKERTQGRVPLDWAMTQNNLGTALMRLGKRESGTAHLEEGVQAFRAALKEFTQERMPLGWAAAQNNLGTALLSLGERESGTARLQEAVQVFAALKDFTAEAAPWYFERASNNLQRALDSIEQRRSGLQQATPRP